MVSGYTQCKKETPHEQRFQMLWEHDNEDPSLHNEHSSKYSKCSVQYVWTTAFVLVD